MWDRDFSCPVCGKAISRAEAFYNNGMCAKCYGKTKSNDNLFNKRKNLLDDWYNENKKGE